MSRTTQKENGPKVKMGGGKKKKMTFKVTSSTKDEDKGRENVKMVTVENKVTSST